MRKLWAVVKREYLQAVRKKSFLIMTVLMPFLMGALMFIPAMLAMKGLGSKKVAVVDGTGRLKEAFAKPVVPETPKEPLDLSSRRNRRGASDALPAKIVPEWVDASDGDPKTAAKPYLARLHDQDRERRLDGVLVVPTDAFLSTDAALTYYSRAAADPMTQERLTSRVNRELTRQRLAARGLDPAEIDRLLKDLRVGAVQVSRSGEEKKGGELNFLVGFLFVILIFLPIVLYGQEIMRGIIQEKTDRVVEILVSSMTPMELLSGKILGMAAVGLTQVAAWVAMGAAVAVWAGAAAMAAGMNLGQFLRPGIAVAFVVFFVLGYLIYVCVYAVGGSIVNSEKEAQQVLGPVMIVLMLPWFLVTPIVMNPDSTLSTVLSLIPVYTPITMFIRVLVSEPPAWQIALSVAMALGTIAGMFWVTAKIFRLGLLATGKRPTIPELWRWVKAA